MRGIYTWAALLCGLGLALVTPAKGAGPLHVTTGASPAILAWSTASEVAFHCDLGNLGTLDNSAARTLVTQLFQVWEDVPHCAIGFTEGPQLGSDVDTVGEFNSLTSVIDATHPIIFDSNGGLTDALLGAGQSNNVLGFAGPLLPANPTSIQDGFAVLNGKFIDGVNNASNPEISQDRFRGVFVHEFGHFINLDHSQINRVQAHDGVGGNDESIPTMYPLIFGATTEEATLHRDDISSVSRIYPEATFATTFGTIEGTVLAGNVGVQGVNVIARKVDDPLTVAVSCVSGFLFRNSDNNSGTTTESFRGFFSIPGLPAGNYTVEIEPVDSRWQGGSSVGPLSPPADGAAFEYWNGFNEASSPITDRAMEQVIIPVAAGQTVSGINFALNFSTGLHQLFSAGNDMGGLDGTQLIFSPNSEAPGGYTVRRITGVNAFPVTGGGNVTLSDESYATVSLGGNSVTLFGSPYHTFNLTSSGFLTFGQGAPGNVQNVDGTEFDSSASVPDHYGPRAKLSALFTDLAVDGLPLNSILVGFDPSIGLVVTYDNVPTFGGLGNARFQILIEPDGDIIYTYLAAQASNPGGALVGIASAGTYSPNVLTTTSFTALQNDVTAPTVTITSPAGNTASGTVNFTADFADANTSSLFKEMRFYVDGREISNPVTTDPGTVSLFTTIQTNGDKRLEVAAWDRSGRVARAVKTVTFNNAGRPDLAFSILSSSRNGPFSTFTLQVTNNGPALAENVTLQDVWLEGTGPSITGVQRIYCNPTSGAPLPRALGNIGVGNSVTIELLGHVPSSVTSVRRWVSRGSVTMSGSNYIF